MSSPQQFLKKPDQHSLTYKELLTFPQPDCLECADHVYHWRKRALPPAIFWAQLIIYILMVIGALALVQLFQEVFWRLETPLLLGILIIMNVTAYLGLRIIVWRIENPLQIFLHRKIMDRLTPVAKAIRIARLQCMNHRKVTIEGFGRLTRLQKKVDQLQEFYEYLQQRPFVYQDDADLQELMQDAQHDIPIMQKSLHDIRTRAEHLFEVALDRLAAMEQEALQLNCNTPDSENPKDIETAAEYYHRIQKAVSIEPCKNLILTASKIINEAEKWTQKIHDVTQKDPSWKRLTLLFRMEHMDEWLVKLSTVVEDLPTPPTMDQFKKIS